MDEYSDEGGGALQRSDAARLQAALEALAARDQVLAERARRLSALEGAADRLAALTARLEAAEAEVAALRRVRAAEVEERDARLAHYESALTSEPAPAAGGATVPAPGLPDAGALAARLARLEEELRRERQRALRLEERAQEGAATEMARLRDALDAARRANLDLQGRLDSLRREIGDTGPGGPYARWEDWFRQRLADRHAGDLQRAEERLSLQHAALEEKERLITLLAARLQALGEISEGPDDLKRIIGIGPVIEDLLHSLGIDSFEQVAALTDEEIDRIGERLGAFRERIRRDGWVEQAAALAAQRTRIGPGLSLG